MPRVARTTTPGAVHHVISRFVDRRWTFRTDAERAKYLELLGRALRRTDWRCLAYCLMSNHIHLAMIAGELPLDSWARKVNSPFARWMNEAHRRLGPVLADRPSAYHIPVAREPRLLAYIHNNPVRAKVVATAAASTWSSHQHYLAPASAPPWLRVDEGLERAGCAGDPTAFDALVTGAASDRWALPNMSSFREQVRRRGPFEVGTPILDEPIEVPIMARPFARAHREAPPVRQVLALACARIGIEPDAVVRRYVYGRAAMAKRVTIQAAVRLGISISDAATAMGVSRQRGCRLAHASLGQDDEAIVREIGELLGGS